ncbi:MAG: hypothetical protein WBE38_12370 [Terracidiphilus sp.]
MNRRRSLLILARLVTFVAVAEAMAIWIFWRSSWTPIERHYLPAYIWCSLPGITPATVDVRLIWKTGRHRKRELATSDDAVDSEDGTGMALSQPAIDAGWKMLIEDPPQQVSAELLRPDLASLVFEDQSLSDLILLPELSAMVTLCVALCTWFLFIGFFRTLITELAWRRRLSSLEEPSPSLFEECTALARRVRSGLVGLHRAAARRIETHTTAPSTTTDRAEPIAKPHCFAFALFGVYNGTSEGYLWRERDGIE